MPYKVISTLRDIIFRTGYAQEVNLNPIHLRGYAELFSRLLSTPRSLKEDCRIVIRYAVNRDQQENVEKLPIPPALKKYIYDIK